MNSFYVVNIEVLISALAARASHTVCLDGYADWARRASPASLVAGTPHFRQYGCRVLR